MSVTLPIRYSLVKHEHTDMDVAAYYQCGKRAVMKKNKPQITRYNNLENVRVSKGLTRPELADLVGVTPTAIYRKERGLRGLRDVEAPRYAKALGVSVSELYLSEHSPTKETEVISSGQIALLDALKDLIVLLVGKKILAESELQALFTYQQNVYQQKGMADAQRMMASLQEFLEDRPRASNFQTMLQLVSLVPVGSA